MQGIMKIWFKVVVIDVARAEWTTQTLRKHLTDLVHEVGSKRVIGV